MLAETKLLSQTFVSGKSVILQEMQVHLRRWRVMGSSPLKSKQSREGEPPRAQSNCQAEKRGSVNPLKCRIRHILVLSTLTPVLPSSGLKQLRGESKTRLSNREEFRTFTQLWWHARSFYTGRGGISTNSFQGSFMHVMFFFYFKGTLMLTCCPWETFWNIFFICCWKTPHTV